MITDRPTIENKKLLHWLQTIFTTHDFSCDLLAGDAGQRCYYRMKKGGNEYIVTDYSKEKGGLEIFVEIAQKMHQAAIPIPKLIFADYQLGYLLQTDLGDTTLLMQLANQSDQMTNHYTEVLEVLNNLQQAQSLNDALPQYKEAQLISESQLFADWYCDRLCQAPLTNQEQQSWQKLQTWLVDNMLTQPFVPVHRDFHSRNIMCSNEKIYLIDFQDAVSGPITYDIISLLYDCYIDLSDQLKKEIFEKHFQKLQQHQLVVESISFEHYLKWCHISAVQRLLKIMGIFPRLAIQDHKKQFLKDLTLTRKHLLEISQLYPEFTSIIEMINTRSPKQ